MSCRSRAVQQRSVFRSSISSRSKTGQYFSPTTSTTNLRNASSSAFDDEDSSADELFRGGAGGFARFSIMEASEAVCVLRRAGALVVRLASLPARTIFATVATRSASPLSHLREQ